MAINTDTQDANLEANPNGAVENNQPQSNEGNTSVIPQQTDANKNKDEGKIYSQKNLDDAAAKARGTAERETRRKLLAQLGLKDDEEDKLLQFKEAYENSLSDEEKRQTEMSNLQAENLKLTQDLEEAEYTIKALIELTGKDESDVEKIVKMAKGLKTDDNTIEEAIKEVIEMVKPNIADNNQTTSTKVDNPDMPHGHEIQQPSSVNISIDTTDNPFKAGQINLTKQGQLLRTNPELAKKLAAEAGVNLKF